MSPIWRQTLALLALAIWLTLAGAWLLSHTVAWLGPITDWQPPPHT